MIQGIKYIVLLLFILPSLRAGESELLLRSPGFPVKDTVNSESVISMPSKPEGGRIGRLLRYLSQNTILTGIQGVSDKHYKKDYSKYLRTVPFEITRNTDAKEKSVMSGLFIYCARFLTPIKYRSGYFITGLCKMLI